MVHSADIDIFARTIYGEARGEYATSGLAALIAVGNVVMNRLTQKSWYGASIREVCQKPWQFSCWNPNDPNQRLLTGDVLVDPIYQICWNVADRLASEQWPYLTKGSDHYHTIALIPLPKWSRGKTPQLRLGEHLFYRLRGT
jgi:spore germination cell wall hydrolase CwlJ-like protein